MDVEEVVKTLSKSERRILRYFSDKGVREAYLDAVARETGMDEAEVSRAALWLENKGVLRRVAEERTIVVPTQKGAMYRDRPLPEQVLLDMLRRERRVKLADLYRRGLLERQELNAAIGILVRHGYARVEQGDGERYLVITPDGERGELRTTHMMKLLLTRGRVEYSSEWDSLIRRGLARKEKERRWKLVLTNLGQEILRRGVPEVEVIERLTPEVIRSGVWRRLPLRWYDVTSPVPRLHAGRKHPLRVIMEKIRQVFLEMGFVEMRGPWVELAFYNMDAMWIPQDHPAREMQATFYLEKPAKGFVLDPELLRIVKEVQETGGDTGSTGWRQPWSPDEALRVLLRTHTTAVTFRVICLLIRKGLVKPPCKFFCIGRVFRNETIDWKHLAEFHQVEGFVVAPGLTLRSLMGYISEFYRRLGITRLRFKPTYNPYTEPSMEIFAWHPRLKRWVEVGNSGLFRPECLWPYGIRMPVIAWGLAVERLAMLLYGIEDIREVLGPMCDLDWIRYYSYPKYALA